VVAIRTREQWGARHDRGAGPAPLPAEFLYLHHTVTRGTGDAAMRTIEQIGEDSFDRGVSYTFAVDTLGAIYEGHGIERRGAHTRGLNSRARAIVAIGNYDVDQPTPALLESIAQLVAHGHRAGWWPRHLTGGHRDAPGAATACPGRHLHAAIPAINRRVGQILAGAPTRPTTPAATPATTHQEPTMMIWREPVASRAAVFAVDHAAGARRRIERPELDAIVGAGGVRHQDPQAKAGWQPPVAGAWLYGIPVAKS